jgi:F-type H+-transporting ATPase subunit b
MVAVWLLCSSRLYAAEGGGSAGDALTRFDPGLLIWTIVTFFVLLFVLWWWAWPPIVKALKAREDAARSAIEDARRERVEAEKLLAEHRALIADARRETAAMVDQGRKDAEKVREELIDRARREQQEVLAQGRRQIEHETRAAVAELKTQAVDLALAASEKLLRRSLDSEDQRRLVEDTLREMSQLNGGEPADAS